MTAPKQITAAYRPLVACRAATSGISKAPGTQATSIAASPTPCARSVSTAPLNNLEVIVSL
jgi:hypothetical protein